MSVLSKVVRIIIAFSFIFSVTVYALPKNVEAVKIKVTNQHSTSLNVAIIYKDPSKNNWITRGWYIVSPNSVRTLDFNASGSSVYLHSYTGNKTWGGTGSGFVTKYVIYQAFSYYDGQSCPQGKNRREVKFTKYDVGNSGVVNYKPV